MADIFLDWGSDLAVDSNGDLLLTSGTSGTNGRVIRRLMTNPGDYLWNLSFGGGLAGMIGEPVQATRIESIIRSQLEMEAAVARTPGPSVTVAVVNSANGIFAAEVTYSDAESGRTATLSI